MPRIGRVALNALGYVAEFGDNQRSLMQRSAGLAPHRMMKDENQGARGFHRDSPRNRRKSCKSSQTLARSLHPSLD